MHCVDLGESFQTHIFLQNFVSIQPRTSPVKFAASDSGKETLAALKRCPLLGHDTSLFSKLVLGCIETKFCNQIRILQQLSKPTKISDRFFAKSSKILQNWKFAKILQILQIFRIFANFTSISANFAKLLKNQLDNLVDFENWWKFKIAAKCVFGCKISFRYSRERA